MILIMPILMPASIMNLTQIVAQQMSEGFEGNPKENLEVCQEIIEATTWDETQWKKHWEDQRQGHRKRLEWLHKESQGLKGSQVFGR